VDPVSDERLREIEREVAATGTPAARLRFAAELERRGLRDDAVATLFQALAAAPQDESVRLALGRFRGPASGEWCLPQGDARNTRRSTARGPRGETGRVLERRLLAPFEAAQFTRTQDQRVETPNPVPPPLLVGSHVYYSLGTGGGRHLLAATADGHVIAENFGAGGWEWSANRDAHVAWRIFTPHEREEDSDSTQWSEPHAVIAPDATIYAFTSFRRLRAIEPTGALRWEHRIDARVNSLALDHERRKLYVLYAHPAGLSTRDLESGRELGWVGLEEIAVASEAVVCDDGRVACISPFGYFAVVAPDGELQRPIYRYAEKISGGYGALAPSGELVVVSFDPRGATVMLFDPASGAKRDAERGGSGALDLPECRGAPTIDAEGVLYLDGGSRYVVGYDLSRSHAKKYQVDRPSLWRAPDQPSSQFALREGELAFIEVTNDGVTLVRVGA
jgi:hypothetical protein